MKLCLKGKSVCWGRRHEQVAGTISFPLVMGYQRASPMPASPLQVLTRDWQPWLSPVNSYIGISPTGQRSTTDLQRKPHPLFHTREEAEKIQSHGYWASSLRKVCLEQWSSNFGQCQNHLENSGKTSRPRPDPTARTLGLWIFQSLSRRFCYKPVWETLA